MTQPVGNGATGAGDLDDDAEPEPEDRTPAPLFGCACENPLSVDTVCPACIEYLREQEEAAGGPAAQKGRP